MELITTAVVLPSWIWNTGPYLKDHLRYVSAGITSECYYVVSQTQVTRMIKYFMYLEKIPNDGPSARPGEILYPTAISNNFILNEVNN